ncbi:lysophospholipid acyltransferase family protein [Flavicella marina]|uniref:lysophospholipid acyltransferase family protein n=1 Tax=Flavicella marina TaxID=1475951 RepID=UPI001265A9AB|nr:lysophospholipid acyltransferase family protein [Flavicella marina]
MKKILSYPLSVVHYLLFGLFICVFHPIQWFSLNVFGYSVHKKSVDALNYFLLWTLYAIGTRIDFSIEEELPENVPLIIVSNHQSANEISPISWYFRKFHPKFVSKKELGKGIPSVSFNLKYGGSVLIDRKDPKQSLTALAKFGKQLEKNNWAGVIFPEGTRSKNGVPKKFSINGLKILSKYAPSAYVVPLTINNSWKLVRNGSFPLGVGVHMKLHAHKPIAVKSMPFDELFQKVEETIKNSVTL